MKDKLIKNDLESLIERFSKTDVISHIENNYKIENVKYVSFKDVCDNHFVKNIKYDNRQIDSIAESIKENGLYNPLIVRKTNRNDKLEILIGRKRWVAAKKIKLEKIPVIISNYDDEETLLVLLADSRDVKNVNPIETATIIKKLNEDFKYKKSDIARILHVSCAQVSNFLSLLKMPSDVIDDISKNKLSFGHAKAISRLSHEQIHYLVSQIYLKDLSVRDVEALVNTFKLKKSNNNFEYLLGVEDTKVVVRFKSKAKAKKAARLIKKVLKTFE